MANLGLQVANSDSGWHENSAGLWHNHKFGFGKMSATRLVARARGWANVGPQIRVALPRQASSHISGHSEGTAEQVVTADDVNGIGFLEHVQIKVNLKLQASRSKLQVDVVCPDGTYSKVLSGRSADSKHDGFTDWTFMTVRCWHTSPIGTWQVRVTNGANDRATLTNFQLILYGTTADPMASHGPNDGGDAGNPVTAPPTKPTLLPTPAPTTPAPSTAGPTTPAPISAAPTPAPTTAPTTAAPSPVPTPMPSPVPTPMPSTAAPTTSTPTVLDATFSPTPAPTTTAPSSAAPTTAGPTAADPTEPPSAAPTPIPTTSGPTRPPTPPPTWPRPTFQWQTQPVPAKTTSTPEPATLHVKGPGTAAVAAELHVGDKGISIHDTAVQTGALVGVTAALVLVAVAFAVRRVIKGQSYSSISSFTNRTLPLRLTLHLACSVHHDDPPPGPGRRVRDCDCDCTPPAIHLQSTCNPLGRLCIKTAAAASGFVCQLRGFRDGVVLLLGLCLGRRVGGGADWSACTFLQCCNDAVVMLSQGSPAAEGPIRSAMSGTRA